MRSNSTFICSVTFSSIRLTFPAEGTGQLAAEEAASDDCDGVYVPGDLVQRLEVLDLEVEKFGPVYF